MWKVSVFGVFLIHIFSAFRWIRTRKTLNTDTFLAVCENRGYAYDHYFLIKSWIFSSCLFSIKKHPCRGAFKNKCSEGLKNSKYLWKNLLLAKFQTFHLQFYQKEPHHRYFWETSWVTVWAAFIPLANRNLYLISFVKRTRTYGQMDSWQERILCRTTNMAYGSVKHYYLHHFR